MSREAHVPFCEGLLGGSSGLLYSLLKSDDCKIYADDDARNLATIRRKILNLVKSHTSKDSVAGKMQRTSWDEKFRAEILFGE
ncbi:hypothetical protein D5R81_07480 [Parashewanella spongiae]|uniref:Uncharacterized protein n=1 Tax=Parashewanella spongiae TaxID=342950 RepID=A0A3A6TPE7_9GAMM|nr:hypothetical protein [Parashewanella spongiae]MCL1078992.1 hypothetical protein [Parashewanella spongiae]RJY17816.1 hypothetical protein D5R81_07480 [Parashewanella spongiae]